jgi:hypothetical protein
MLPMMDDPLWVEHLDHRSSQTAEERRANQRNICEVAVRWSRFNTAPTHEGALKNYSNNGVYIELNDVLLPGTYLLVQIEKIDSVNAPEGAGECLRMNGIAEVKWCREFQEGLGQRYGAGLRYLVPL